MEKLTIWGTKIPYNNPEKRKIDVMKIKHKWKPFAMISWIKNVFGTNIAKDSSGLDTYTYLDEIKNGKVSEYFDDVPNLIPFFVKGSDTAVIIAPGGGFCTQSRENEGYEIAKILNQNNITAFVLDYRMNPYEAPVCYLDMQRAIRYVRYHAAEYNLKPERIGAMGFSAGGYVAGASTILLGNKTVDYPGYKSDDIDLMDGIPSFLGLIYPVTNFDENPNMLCLLAGDDFFDESKRVTLQKKYSLTKNLQPSNIPQFLCYGTKDMLKGIDKYGNRLEELGIPHEEIVLEGAGHGFSVNKKYISWIIKYIKWLKDNV